MMRRCRRDEWLATDQAANRNADIACLGRRCALLLSEVDAPVIPQTEVSTRADRAETLGTPAILRPWAGMRRGAGNFAWLLVGKLGQLGANAGTMLLLAYFLDLAAYGLFVTAVGLQLLLSRGVLLGMDRGMLRLRMLPEWRACPDAVMQTGLALLLGAGGVTLLGAVVLAWGLNRLAPTPWPDYLVVALALGAIGVALVDYVTGYRIARMEYRAAGLLQCGTAVVRLAFIIGALWAATSNLQLVFLAYIAASLIVGGLQAASAAREARKEGKRWRPQARLTRHLIRFSVWKAAADLGSVLSLHLGVFLLTFLGQRTPAGLFGLGLTLSMAFFAVVNAFADYLVSRIVQVRRRADLPRYLKRAYAAAVGVILLCIPAILLVSTLAPWILRSNQLVHVFLVLAASMLLLILQCPLTAVCYYLMRPHYAFAALVACVAANGGIGILLIPTWGAKGAAYAQLGGTAFGLAAIAALVGIAARSDDRRVDEAACG